MDGNISGKKVLDPGAGFGVLSYAALLLGASSVTSVEIDGKQGPVLRKNLSPFHNSEIIIGNVSEVKDNYDTAVCNPPFGAVVRDSDLPFLETIFEKSKDIYLIHNVKNRDFILSYIKDRGTVEREENITLIIPRMYPHHTQDQGKLKCVLFWAKSSL